MDVELHVKGVRTAVFIISNCSLFSHSKQSQDQIVSESATLYYHIYIIQYRFTALCTIGEPPGSPSPDQKAGLESL